MERSVWSYGVMILLFILPNIVKSQTYILGSGGATGTVTTCSGTFYDPGGPTNNYSDDQNFSITFESEDPSNFIVVGFISWNLEDNVSCSYDRLTIYDGANTSAPLIGTYCTTSPGTVIATGTSLHFVFESDGSVTESGWEATIACASDMLKCTNYKDEFSSANYDNSNGTESWTVESWIETNDNSNPSSGNILITGGEIRFGNSSTGRSVERNVDLADASSAILSFDIRESGSHENADITYVDIYDGSVWTNVFSINNDFTLPTQVIDIIDYATADTKIRIRVQNHSGSEYIYFDDINIEYCRFLTSTTTSFTLEAECGFKGSSWSIISDPTASNGLYVTPVVGLNSAGSAPADTLDYLTYVVEIDTAGDYELFGRIIAPNGADDSFWVRANGGTWYRWNGLSIATTWTWRQVWDSDNSDALVSFTLPLGTNRIDIAYREDGTQLDKLFLTLDESIPSGIGGIANNCSAIIGVDTDGDGVADSEDLDDDNDGIPDIIESPATISFGGTKTMLVGSDTLNLTVGHKVLYANAIRDCDDIFYDIVITVTAKSSGSTQVQATNRGMWIANGVPSSNTYFTFTIDVVESGSATVGFPTGTPASISNFVLELRDIDSESTSANMTEVAGFRNTTAPDSFWLHTTTFLQQAGYVSGGPSGYTQFRLIPNDPAPNWTSNAPSAETDKENTVYWQYNNFSSVEISYGLTGGASSAGARLTGLSASKECDRDNDGVPNRIDLDLDNDGIFDLYEAGHSEIDLNDDGRIDNADVLSGANGLFNDIETTPESGVLNYPISDSDGDGVQDPFDLDSDNDGCFDTEEADVPDGEPDGTAGSGTATSDANGLVVSVVYQEPPTGAWQDSLASCLEICDNGLDDDGDGDVDEEDADCANYYLEAECAFPGENWDRGLDVLASNNDYVTISSGLNSESVPPVAAADLMRFTVNVSVAGLYRLLARVYSPTGADDSFWVRIDEGTWYKWNDWNTASQWQWLPITDNDNGNTLVKFSLLPGNHIIDFAYREDGARLDKLHLTINGTTPEDLGEDAINCGRTVTYNLFLPHKVLNK